MERMVRELKTSNEGVEKTMNEQFAQLAKSNRERGTLPSQPKLNSRGGTSRSSTKFEREAFSLFLCPQ